MFVGCGLGITSQKAASAVTYSDQATAYFAAMSVQPDTNRKTLLAALIDGLVSDGVWVLLDGLYIIAAHDAQAARVNAKTPSVVATVAGSMTFLQDRHYVGDGTTGYLASGFNPTVGTPNFVQNSAHMGVWVRNNVTLSTYIDVGASNARINTRDSATAPVRANSATATTASLSVSTSIGHTMWTRNASGAASGTVYKDGVSIATIATTTAAPANAEFLIGAQNTSTTGTVTAANFSIRQIAAAHWGAHLDATKTAALYSRLSTYLTAVGA